MPASGRSIGSNASGVALTGEHFRLKSSARWGLPLTTLSILSGLATYGILTGLTPITPSPDVIMSLMAINLLMVTAMVILIGWQLRQLLAARRRGMAGAVLHSRIVMLLSLFTAVPAVIVAVFASVTLNRGLDAWFSQRTQSIVDSAIAVAEAYLSEQSDIARIDTLSIANDINGNYELFQSDRQQFARRLAALSGLRGLHGAFVIDRRNRRLEASATSSRRIIYRPPDDASFKKADRGEIAITGPGTGNVIRAVARLKDFPHHYLYIYRLVNPRVVYQRKKAIEEKAEFEKIKAQRMGVQVTFALMYAGVTFIFLLAAVWFGLWFADLLVKPIAGLVVAARKVSEGDFGVKVKIPKALGDLATLGRSFNRMTGQLKQQRDAIVTVNRQLDERRLFTEAVLSGVSAGVIGLDADERITLVNPQACKLLRTEEGVLRGQPLESVLPQMATLPRRAANAGGTAGAELALPVEGNERNFMVRVTKEGVGEITHGYVITFDDITDLVAAQRQAAWADIARRIAHEIKNPLTPIQLSAERLQRKYRKEIVTNPEVFAQCTDTIIRQVNDIGQMVDEFSAFARMPRAILASQDIAAVAREALVLQRASAPDIIFTFDFPQNPVIFPLDRRLVTQAITNLAKNAQESIDTRKSTDPQMTGRIHVAISAETLRKAPSGETVEEVAITVTDNGRGFPETGRTKLTEPYVTTRDKGTGLGLAIVSRIMEEHGGRIDLLDAPSDFDPSGSGAQVKLVFESSSSANVSKDGAHDEKQPGE